MKTSMICNNCLIYISIFLNSFVMHSDQSSVLVGKKPSHKEWRKVAKRERRKKIRTMRAKEKEGFSLTGDDYENWLKEQEMLQLFEIEQIEQSNREENEKWLQAEKYAIQKWHILQEKQRATLQKRLEQENRIKLELELEQKRRLEQEKKLKEIEEENKRNQEIFNNKLEQFLSGDATEAPREWLIIRETKPESDLCPFFTKTACCRFGDQCSRNHQYPGISKVLLAVNFYQHFGLENANFNEYDTDLMLEYEENDTYKEYKEFFHDVLEEFKKFGKVVQFKVCNNHERHLRGNTYVQYAELRGAVAAYRAMHARWYAGRQLTLQFCHINSWKNAICGLQSRRRCPKGRACNFLHVFRNPNNMYNNYDIEEKRERTPRTPPRSWRWSESPEVELPRHTRSKSNEKRQESTDSRRGSTDTDLYSQKSRKPRLKRRSERRERSLKRSRRKSNDRRRSRSRDIKKNAHKRKSYIESPV